MNRLLPVSAVLLLFLGVLDLPWPGQIGVSLVEATSQSQYYNLMDDLFTSPNAYRPEVRPTSTGATTVIFIGISLRSIQDLDEKSQVLESSLVIEAEWFDEYLSWDASHYGGVTSFLFPQKNVWLPDMIIENSIESQKQMGYDQNVVRVENSGAVVWSINQVVKTGCDIDVTFYPFDTQTCVIIISTWMSTQDDIQIFPDANSDGILLDEYSPSGTWDIVSNEREHLINKNNNTRLFFTLKLKRRRTYYVLNIILPVLFLSFTASMVFFLPADAGEKIGMGITVLLAFAVYLTIIADNTPQTSLQVSYLAVYLTLLLGLTSMGVVLAVVVLHIHHKSEECEIGKRTERITRKLRAMLGINSTDKEAEMDSRNQAVSKRKSPSAQARFRSAVAPTIDDDEGSPPPSYRENKEKITWPKVAEVFDRVMFYVTSSLIAIITLVFIPVLALGDNL